MLSRVRPFAGPASSIARHLRPRRGLGTKNKGSPAGVRARAFCDTLAVGVDPVKLRAAVSTVVRGLQSFSHRELTELGPELGLPMPEESVGTKRQRLEACLAALTDDGLLLVAQRLLDSQQVLVRGTQRFALEDAVWQAGPAMEIPGRVRREVAHAIDLDELRHRSDRFERLLERFWVLDDDPLASLTDSSPRSLRALIQRHVFRNPGDWSAEELFERLGVFEAGSPRFGRFLEGLVDPATLPDAAAQERVVEAVNVVLMRAGLRLEQTGHRDGYPYFQLLRTGPGAVRRPKTLIFATHLKPDIRFLSVVDNDIEVLQGRDQVLVYDRDVGPEGIRWCDLQRWWQETSGTGDEAEAKNALYQRLLTSMPMDGDSPQRDFYRLYHAIYGLRVWTLPALLPEVWVHWDHKTRPQRGAEALLNHRMDFLMLLPNGPRIVLEIDGSHHYNSASAYTDTVRGDRDLKLRGYEVYRFSTTELSDPTKPSDRHKAGPLVTWHRAAPLLKRFFADLFEQHGLTVPATTESGDPRHSV